MKVYFVDGSLNNMFPCPKFLTELVRDTGHQSLKSFLPGGNEHHMQEWNYKEKIYLYNPKYLDISRIITQITVP